MLGADENSPGDKVVNKIWAKTRKLHQNMKPNN